MKTINIKLVFMSAFAAFALTACNNDDDGTKPMVMATCTDNIMNGTETGVDCGGDCTPCTVALDFSGTYAQADHMGRPGINTVLSNSSIKDAHNVTIPSMMVAAFQEPFLNQAVALHDAFGTTYENNILGLDATTLTTVLAADVLEVAPNNITAYFIPGEDADNDGNVLNDAPVIGLTGRTLHDDVIDVSLILLFGGEDGIRFSGQDTNDDGMADLPRLISDGVSLTANLSTTFPFLGAPE